MKKKGYQRIDQYDEESVDKLASFYKEILPEIGEDPSREGLIKTPERVAKALMFLTHGYELKPAEIPAAQSPASCSAKYASSAHIIVLPDPWPPKGCEDVFPESVVQDSQLWPGIIFYILPHQSKIEDHQQPQQGTYKVFNKWCNHLGG